MAEVLIVGPVGGREHALGVALANGGEHDIIFTHGGNAGTADVGENLDVSDFDEIKKLATNRGVEQVVIGPEAPLARGFAGDLRRYGAYVVGPNYDGARLEASKWHAHDFMRIAEIDQPESLLTRNPKMAIAAMQKAALAGTPLPVIKADGLAAGKGVTLPDSLDEATDVLMKMMVGYEVDEADGKRRREYLFGQAGRRVVLQERLTGPEVSMFALLDGHRRGKPAMTRARVLGLAQDHKRLLDGDAGENTGGMGAYSPVPADIVSDTQYGQMLETLEKTLDHLDIRNIDYKGILYIGFMLAREYADTPVVMEYNVRFGDPEAEAVLPLLQRSGVNVHDLFLQAAKGELDGDRIATIEHASDQKAVTVCLASKGYGQTGATIRKGVLVHGLGTIDSSDESAMVFHGGTRFDEKGRVVTAGGRVLYVSGFGETIDAAAANAYSHIGQKGIHFAGMQYRTDIAHQARTVT